MGVACKLILIMVGDYLLLKCNILGGCITASGISSCLSLATSVTCPSIYFILIHLIDTCLISAFCAAGGVAGAREIKLLGRDPCPLKLIVW